MENHRLQKKYWLKKRDKNQLKFHVFKCEHATHSLSAFMFTIASPVPCFESIAGPLEQVALHDDPVWRIHVEFQLGLIVGKVLGEEQTE